MWGITAEILPKMSASPQMAYVQCVPWLTLLWLGAALNMVIRTEERKSMMAPSSPMLILTQIINLVFLLCLLGLPALALVMLFRARPAPELALVLWVLVIVAVPILGPLAYFLSRVVRPEAGALGSRH